MIDDRLSADDRKMLEELLAKVPDEDYREELRFDAVAFKGMLDHGYALTDKQRTWLRDVHERIVGEPAYLNLFSSGKAALGSYGKTAVPEVLKKPLPLKPPGRK